MGRPAIEALAGLSDTNLNDTVLVRGVEFKVHEALHRSLAHCQLSRRTDRVPRQVLPRRRLEDAEHRARSVAGLQRATPRVNGPPAHIAPHARQSSEARGYRGQTRNRCRRARRGGDPRRGRRLGGAARHADVGAGRGRRGPHRRGGRHWPLLAGVVRRRTGGHRQVSARRRGVLARTSAAIARPTSIGWRCAGSLRVEGFQRR